MFIYKAKNSDVAGPTVHGHGPDERLKTAIRIQRTQCTVSGYGPIIKRENLSFMLLSTSSSTPIFYFSPLAINSPSFALVLPPSRSIHDARTVHASRTTLLTPTLMTELQLCVSADFFISFWIFCVILCFLII